MPDQTLYRVELDGGIVADLTGQSIGPYQIVERLGRGGMADVYKAFHPGLAVYRAIKVIRPEFASEEGFTDRFQREAQAVASMRHPNIVQMHDFGTQDNLYYMVMEFIDGTDLKHHIAERGAIRPFGDALRIVEQIASALNYAHGRGVVHRDIKPANIMLDREGRAILTDFGIARMVAAQERLTQTGISMGTPAYMAPEQIEAHEAGASADIYSLGVILYEMLTGRVPFDADTPLAVLLKVMSEPVPPPRQVAPDIPENLQAAILKATAKDPAQRYATAQAFADALVQSVSTDPHVVASIPVDTPLKPVSHRRLSMSPGLLFGAIAVLAVLIIGMVIILATRPATSEATPLAGETSTSQPVTTFETNGVPTQAPAATSGVADIQLGTRVAGRLASADEVVSLTIEGVEAQSVYFDFRELSGSAKFVLLTPDGLQEVFNNIGVSPDTADSGPYTFEQNGLHELRIEPLSDDGVSYEFVVWSIEPPVIDGGTLAYGTLIGGETTIPGQSIQYMLNGEAGQSLFFDFRELTTAADLILLAPDGLSEVFDTLGVSDGTADTGPITLEQSGSYSFTVDPRGDGVLKFSFIAWQVDPAVIDGGTLALNVLVSGSVDQPGQSVDYMLDGRAGQSLYFDYKTLSDATDFRMIAPDGFSEVFSYIGVSDGTADAGPFTLKQDGTHVFSIDPRDDKTIDYGLVVWDIDPLVIEGGVIELDTLLSGSIDTPGQSVVYMFEATAGQSIALDFQTLSETTDFILLAPDGVTEVFNYFGVSADNANSGPYTLEQTGTYTFTIDPRDDNTLEYALSMTSQ